MRGLTTRSFAIFCIVIIAVACLAMTQIGKRGAGPQSVARSGKSIDKFNSKALKAATSSQGAAAFSDRSNDASSSTSRPDKTREANSAHEEPLDIARLLLNPAPKTPAGYSQAISVRGNPAVRKVSNDLRVGGKAAVTNQFVAGEPFDPVRYQQAPEEYLDTVEPGRVFETAQPGPDVPVLKRIGRPFSRVLQGETVSLKAKTEPGAPVSFASARLGEFQNRLTAITVSANEEGIAEARFTATPGTQGDIDIMAASPVTSGQIHFYILVDIPDAH